MRGVTVDFSPPTQPLQVLKAFLDLATALLFVVLLVAVVVAARKYPVLERRTTFYLLIVFALLGIVSTTMDAYDEWFWFIPGSFYNEVWKPTRLGLFLVAIFALVLSFHWFYKFSERLFGEE